MAIHNISITVKDQIKKKELTQCIKVFSALEELTEHNTLIKAIFKGVVEDIQSILIDFQDSTDSDYISFMQPETTAEFFRNYFNSANVVKFKSSYVSRGEAVGDYVIKKGSRICKLTPTESVGAATKSRMQELIDNGTIDENGFFTADGTVSSASMAATIIAGTPTSGKKIFKNILW